MSRSIKDIEHELDQLDRAGGRFQRTRLLVIIARLLLVIVQRGSVM